MLQPIRLSLMIFASATQLCIYLPWVNACLEYCLNCENTSRRFQPGEDHLLRKDPSRDLSRAKVKMACTFLPNSAQFFRFKNRCKITSRKKSSLTSALVLASLGVKLPFLSKKCIFWAEKGIFSKSSFYTKMFSDPKYSLLVCQK